MCDFFHLSFFFKYTASMDNSSLFFLTAEHWFTWDRIVLLKKVYFGRKIFKKEKEKNLPKINQ